MFVFVAFQYHPLVWKFRSLNSQGVTFYFGIAMASCNLWKSYTFRSMQDVSKILPELKAGYFFWIFWIGHYQGKKHGCEHSQKGVGRKKISDLIKINKKWAATHHKLITAMEHPPFWWYLPQKLAGAGYVSWSRRRFPSLFVIPMASPPACEIFWGTGSADPKYGWFHKAMKKRGPWYIGDYITQLNEDYNKPLQGSNHQYNGK